MYDYRLNAIADAAHYMLYWYTPYDIGNLARSIGDVGIRDMPANSVGFVPFDKNQAAPYGAILNECEIINYRVRNPRTGVVNEGYYTNKHYKWCDNFAELYANMIPMMFPGVRRIG